MTPHQKRPDATQTAIHNGTGCLSFEAELLAALLPAVKELTGVMRQLAEEQAAQRMEREREASFRREVRESIRATVAAQ